MGILFPESELDKPITVPAPPIVLNDGRVIETAPFDPRFPNTNQTKNCYINYLDYHRCRRAKSSRGEDITPCDYYQKVYKTLCPSFWHEKWDEQREEGIFPAEHRINMPGKIKPKSGSSESVEKKK